MQGAGPHHQNLHSSKSGSIAKPAENEQKPQRYEGTRNFQDVHYVSASEASWRLLEFNRINRNAPVVCLEVHLENYHTVYIPEGAEIAVFAQSRPGTILTEWVKYNEINPGTT